MVGVCRISMSAGKRCGHTVDGQTVLALGICSILRTCEGYAFGLTSCIQGATVIGFGTISMLHHS